MYFEEQSVFAGHIVSSRSDRTERGPPQDKLVSAEPHQVSEIRVPSGKLLNLDPTRIEGLVQI
jgi:hypothetical protein